MFFLNCVFIPSKLQFLKGRKIWSLRGIFPLSVIHNSLQFFWSRWWMIQHYSSMEIDPKAGIESLLLSVNWIIKIYELYQSTNLFLLFILIYCSRILRIKQSLDSMIYQNRYDYFLFNTSSVYCISESCWYGEADWS